MTVLNDALKAVSAAVAPPPGEATTTRKGINTLPVADDSSSLWSCLHYPPDNTGPHDAWLTVELVKYPTQTETVQHVLVMLHMQYPRTSPKDTWNAMAAALDGDGVRAILEDTPIITADGTMTIDVTVKQGRIGTPESQMSGNYATLQFALVLWINSN